jgi:hypothetical protein
MSLRVAPSDAGVSWLVELRPDGRTITRDADGTADCTLSGPSGAIYLNLWNRVGTVQVSGDERAVQLWHRLARVRWR